jgi:hypothetical protein
MDGEGNGERIGENGSHSNADKVGVAKFRGIGHQNLFLQLNHLLQCIMALLMTTAILRRMLPTLLLTLGF